MALQSQAPRGAVTQRYTNNSRKRKRSLAPWLVLGGVAVILIGLWVIFGGQDDATDSLTSDTDAENAQQADADNAANPANTPATSSHTPSTVSGPTSPRPVVPTLPTTSSTSNNTPRATTVVTPDTPATPPTIPTALPDSRNLVGENKDQYETGMQLLESGDIHAGRALLSELLFRDGALPRHEAQALRLRLGNLSERIVFSSKNRSAEKVLDDPILTMHKVQSGEFLGPIGNRYKIPYQLIERINGIKANRLQAGQSIQVIKGPVHAKVDKSDYRMDLFVYDDAGVPVYLKSYIVGLGEFDSTPLGIWRIKPGSKVGPANGGPSWRNPRTGEVYDRNDPDIPIGEYWMALEGMDDNTKGKAGYGIHATNDPDSIGRQESMGCIRMRDADVDEVFYTLFEGASTVEIVP